MASEAAVLLDQLMGTTRNSVPGDNTKELSWSDEEVCKHYLCGFCPSELFVNTKAEAAIGSCYKVHDERLKKSYEESSDKGHYGYEDIFLSYLERLIRDLDRKVERGKDRLRRSAEAKQQSLHGDGPGGCSEKLKELNHNIDEMVKELQLLGELGHVEEAQELMNKLDQLEKERETERLTLSNTAPKVLAGFELDSNDFHEKMELCDVCGSFLVIGDTQSRVDAHLLGKQHIGFARIRTTIADLKLKREDRFRTQQEELSQRRNQQQEDPSSHHRKRSHRSHSRSRRRSHRSNSHDKNRKGSPHGRRGRRRKYSGRSRSRSRDKRRSRSRSRDKRRSRSRDKRRSRSRSRDKRRTHSRGRSRSHSREKRRARSRSRDKRRARSRSKNRKRSHSRSRERKRSLSKSRRSRSKSQDTLVRRNGDEAVGKKAEQD